jgi:hypothetical protein
VVKVEDKKDNKPAKLPGATPPEWHLDKPQKSRYAPLKGCVFVLFMELM